MTIYDIRNPSRRGTLIEWIRPKDDEAFAVVKFPGSLTPERVPEHRVQFVGKLLTAKQQAALDARGWTLAKLQEVADGNGFSLQEAAEALCE
ncbi:MAG: hypothetical protein KGL35_00845 [Bradyrhizobium sp.]|nr:hypothetical protein [Bradyrhizobium sp.]